MRFRRLRPAVSSLSQARRGFTLIEILIVIGIISLLVALLFPAFQGTRERSRQGSCLSNLQQIYLATRLYKDDEREYPMSLAVLLPDTALLQNTAGAADTNSGANIGGTGYFRKSAEILVCPDDNTQMPAADPSGVPNARSSYGDLSNAPTQAASYENTTTYDSQSAAFYDAPNAPDWGRLAWNYWGYDQFGVAFRTPDEALAYLNALPVADARRLLKIPTKAPSSGYVAPPAIQSLFNSKAIYFNPRGLARDGTIAGSQFLEEPREENPLRYSLANRFAPEGTVITHCIFHRIATGSGVRTVNPRAFYGDPNGAKTARDVVLRVDGSAKSYNVSNWNVATATHAPRWQNPDF